MFMYVYLYLFIFIYVYLYFYSNEGIYNIIIYIIIHSDWFKITLFSFTINDARSTFIPILFETLIYNVLRFRRNTFTSTTPIAFYFVR